ARPRLEAGDARARCAGRAVVLRRRAGRPRPARPHHSPALLIDRGPPAATRRPRPAQEASRLVFGRARGQRAPAHRALPGRPRGCGSGDVLGQLVKQLFFEDFVVGDRFGSPSRTLTDAHFMFFAGMTGDAHPIHYDDEYAKKTRFGRRLAHGLLLTSLTAVGASTLAPLIEDSIVAFLDQSTRFVAPAFVGDTLKPDHEVIALERKRSAGLVTLKVTLTNQRGELVLEGQHKYLIAYRPAA